MEDIQETHSRTEGAPKNFVAAELTKSWTRRRILRAAVWNNGCRSIASKTGFPYRLTKEKQWLIQIGSKSDFIKLHILQRGKKNENH